MPLIYLWLNGKDLRPLPLVARKDRLKRVLPTRSPHMLYVDHVRATSTDLYRLVCQLDLEGIVAKKADILMKTIGATRIGSRSSSLALGRISPEKGG